MRLVKTGYSEEEKQLIRYKILELLEQKSLKEGKKISLSQLGREIGLQSSAMSKLTKNRGYYSSLQTIEALCKYFNCKVEDVIEVVIEE